MKREYVPLAQLAEMDFHIEANILKRPIGKQDPYMAAFGGLTVLEIGKDGTVIVRKANVSYEIADELNKNMLIFFTGKTRSADEILREQEKGAKEQKSNVVDSMHYIKEIGYQILEAVESGNIDVVGRNSTSIGSTKRRFLLRCLTLSLIGFTMWRWKAAHWAVRYRVPEGADSSHFTFPRARGLSAKRCAS